MALITDKTATEDSLTRVQLKTPLEIWKAIKIQAVREDLSAEQLATKAFEAYLASRA